jgi:signal transduction histidine kinase
MPSQSLSKANRGQEANRVRRLQQNPCGANLRMHELLGELGHELRTPLAAIQNALQVLELQGHDAPTREWARSLMERQTRCIVRLVEDMLEVSRIEHGKIPLRKQALDLGQTVTRAIETVRAAVEERCHELVVILPAKPVTFLADPVRLEQMLTNLLNNAVKYTEPGGRIWVAAERQGGDILFGVRDSGIGIDPNVLPHVFDPYWQLGDMLDRSQGGLGIGLPLVRKLAEMHGGSASAFSAGLGHGSEFIVRLPAIIEPLQHSGCTCGKKPPVIHTANLACQMKEE